MKYTPIGVDIAKHVMQIHYVDPHSGELVDKKVRRNTFLTFFSNREPCLIGMEACGGSQLWARELKKLGHEVRLLQGKFVKAFVMGNKNDVMDARAIWMAVLQPGTELQPTVKVKISEALQNGMRSYRHHTFLLLLRMVRNPDNLFRSDDCAVVKSYRLNIKNSSKFVVITNEINAFECKCRQIRKYILMCADGLNSLNISWRFSK